MPTEKPVTVAEYIARRLSQYLEPHADAIVKGVASLEGFFNQLRTAVETVAVSLEGPLTALSKVDWVDVKLRLDSLPEKSKMR